MDLWGSAGKYQDNKSQGSVCMEVLIITRLNLQWNKPLTPEFVNNSIRRMESINRSSLKNQSCQDFTLLTLTDETMTDYGDPLENEVIIKIPNIGEYNNTGIVHAIKNYVKNLDCESVITIRLDSDDALHKDFIKNIYNNNIPINHYADIVSGFPCYDIKTGKVYTSKKHDKRFTTQFVSFHELKKDFKCAVMMQSHTEMGKLYRGNCYNNLKALQFIHNENHSTKIYKEAKEIKIDLLEYGIRI